MNYSKIYLAIVVFSFFLALWMIGEAKSLETTWTGIYTPPPNVQAELKEYSPVFATRKRCEKWLKKYHLLRPQGSYACGKNCIFEKGGFFSCEKLYNY